MPQLPPTKAGKLSDTARHVVLPSGIVTTGWPAVRDTCSTFGVTFDAWQDGTGRAILAKRKNGIYAASVGGVVISIPRQVGKTFLIGAIVFALCLLHPGLTVIWTAHRVRTADETFASMQAFAKRRKIKPHVDKIVLGAGDEAVEFVNGSRILFGARERGFGRGFADVGVVMFDEAQILSDNAIDDMVPATNTAANPLLIFTGTPPKDTDPSEVFTRKRADALSGEDEDTVYIEFSADPDASPADRKQWAKANPGYPKRTNEAAMLRMKKNLSEDSFVREALGIWAEVSTSQKIPAESWALCEHGDSSLTGPQQFGIAVADDRSMAAIAAAGRSDKYDGCHSELVAYKPGVRWVITEAVRLKAAWGGKFAIVKGSPAMSLIPDLITAGLIEDDIVEVSIEDNAERCGQLFDAVVEGRFVHRGEGELNRSLRDAVDRPYGDEWVWSQRKSKGDISPLVAVTSAAGLHGLGVPQMAQPGVVML